MSRYDFSFASKVPAERKRKCGNCGREFTPRMGKQYLCSSNCRGHKRHVAESWLTMREFVLERDNYTCGECGQTLLEFELDVHHVKLACLGGTDDEENLIVLCRTCHKKKHATFG